MTVVSGRISDEQALSGAPRARAMRTLSNWIQAGVLRGGEPLPSERTLSERLGVSRKTLRWTLSALEKEGLLENRGARTRIVLPPVQHPAASFVAKSILILNNEMTPPPGFNLPGWSVYITTGAVSGAHGAGLNAFSVQSQHQFFEDGGASILQSPPYGVLAPELKIPAAKIAALAHKLVSAGVRVVLYGDDYSYASFDRVTSDHETGAYELTRHLISLGRRRILCVFPRDDQGYWLRDRISGYERAMREAGLTPLPVEWLETIPDAPTAPERFTALTHLIAGHLVGHLRGEQPVDAIMAVSDGHVFHIGAACRLFGKTPNQDVLLAGYDNYSDEVIDRQFEPLRPIATVDKRNWEMGQWMTQLLVDRVEGKLPPAPQRRVMMPKLCTLEHSAGN